MTVYVFQGPVSQTFNIADSVSLTNGNGDGFTFCGTRSYEVTPAFGTLPGFITVIGDTITVETSNPLDA